MPAPKRKLKSVIDTGKQPMRLPRGMKQITSAQKHALLWAVAKGLLPIEDLIEVTRVRKRQTTTSTQPLQQDPLTELLTTIYLLRPLD